MNDIPEKIYINPESFRTPSGKWQGRLFPSEVEYVPAASIEQLKAENEKLKEAILECTGLFCDAWKCLSEQADAE